MKKQILKSLLLLVLFSCSSSNNNDVEEILPYNQEGELLQSVFYEKGTVLEFFIYKENKPIARYLYPFNYLVSSKYLAPIFFIDLEEKRVYTKNLHYYLYNNLGKIVETIMYNKSGFLFFYENGKVFSKNMDNNIELEVTTGNIGYSYIKHEYISNNKIKFIFYSNGLEMSKEITFNSEGLQVSQDFIYFNNWGDERIQDYNYLTDKIEINEKIFDTFLTHNTYYINHQNITNPYWVLLSKFGLTDFDSVDGPNLVIYPAFSYLKYFKKSKSNVLESNKFHLPTKTIYDPMIGGNYPNRGIVKYSYQK